MDTEKLRQEAIELRKEKHQMIKTELNAGLNDGHDLAIVYTPGVSAPCLAIKDDEDLSLTMTWRGNVVAVISDGTWRYRSCCFHAGYGRQICSVQEIWQH